MHRGFLLALGRPRSRTTAYLVGAPVISIRGVKRSMKHMRLETKIYGLERKNLESRPYSYCPIRVWEGKFTALYIVVSQKTD